MKKRKYFLVSFFALTLSIWVKAQNVWEFKDCGGDKGRVAYYSRDWYPAPSGTYSLKLEVVNPQSKYVVFSSNILQEQINPDYILIAIKNMGVPVNIKVEALINDQNKTVLLDNTPLSANYINSSLRIENPGKMSLNEMRIVLDGYGTNNGSILIDNIRYGKDGHEYLLENFESLARISNISWQNRSDYGGDPGNILYDTDWHPEKISSMKLLVNNPHGSQYAVFSSGVFSPAIIPDSFKIALKSNATFGVKFEAVKNGIPSLLKELSAYPLEDKNYRIDNPNHYTLDELRITLFNYTSGNLNVFGLIDNLRYYANGIEHIIENFEAIGEVNNANWEYKYNSGGTGNIIYTTEWHTTGKSSMKFDVVNPISWAVFTTNNFCTYMKPDSLKFDIRNTTSNTTNLKIEGFYNGTSQQIGSTFTIRANYNNPQFITSFKLDNTISKVKFSELRLVFDNYGNSFVPINIDNIRYYLGGKEFILDNCEGNRLPEANADPATYNIKNTGIPYMVDDFDARSLINDVQLEEYRNINDFSGETGIWRADANDLVNFSVSSSTNGGYARSVPFSGKITYNLNVANNNTRSVAYWSQLQLPAYNMQNPYSADLSNSVLGLNASGIQFWMRSAPGKNPQNVLFIMADTANRQIKCTISGISDNQWKLYRIPFNPQEIFIQNSFDFSAVKEVKLEISNSLASVNEGELYIDDIAFVDTTMKFENNSFNINDKNNPFLVLLEKRTFKYFLDSYDPRTGLFRDRASNSILASAAATGWGLSALPIGVKNGWISGDKAADMVLKTLNTLYLKPQNNSVDGTIGFKGFFYHYLDISTGLRYMPWGTELSSIDSEKLLQGILTCKQYFKNHPKGQQIAYLADTIYKRMDWKFFLDTTKAYNPDYNQFYMEWRPETQTYKAANNPKTPYWNMFSDETTLVQLAAIGSPTFPVSKDVFYSYPRYQGQYKGRGMTMSKDGSMFQYFFLHCWYDLRNKVDEKNLNFYRNAIQAGLANREFCIEGKNFTGKTSPTFNANSWGLSACDATAPGQHYLGANGALPNVYNQMSGSIPSNVDGTVPAYGGVSMIGFCTPDITGGDAMPVEYISGLLQNYYRNTQLWTGYYGFRDSYSDTTYKKPGATSKLPMYKNDYVAIDQGPMLIMIENYRSGLIRENFMNNPEIQNAVNTVFSTPDATAKVPTAECLNIKAFRTSNSAEAVTYKFIDNFDGINMGISWHTPDPQIYSINTTDNSKNSDGTNCMKISYNKPIGSVWTSIQTDFPSGNRDVSGYNAISFKAAAENSTFVFKIEGTNNTGSTPSNSENTYTVSGNNWQSITFPINCAQAQKLVIFPCGGNGAAMSGALYLDEIKLLKVDGDAIYDYAPVAGDSLKASYTFNDPNGDLEQNSTYRWLKSDTYSGTYTAISGATTGSYIMQPTDEGKYIKFELTPVSNTSPITGAPVQSLPTRVGTYFDIHLSDVPYEEKQVSTASACANMVLKYGGNFNLGQQTLDNYGIAHNATTGLNFVDPQGLAGTLNAFESPAPYDFWPISQEEQTNTFNDICHWISKFQVNKSRNNMPSFVPLFGDFNHWIVVNGFQSSKDPQKSSTGYTVFGFYVKDPLVDGIGKDKFVSTPVFSNYFMPIALEGSTWNGKYVSINKVPSVQSVTKGNALPYQSPSSNELRFQAAERGFSNYHLQNNNALGNAYKGTVRGRVYFVDLTGTLNDYYIVTYEKNGGPVVAITIDANNGAIKEATYMGTPDMNYYNYLAGSGYPRMTTKSARIDKTVNAFYPDLVSVSDITKLNTSTQVKENYMDDLFSITPNPAKDYAYMNFNLLQSSDIVITIFNISGKIMKIYNNHMEIGNNNFKAGLEGLPEGIYFCKLSTNGKTQVKKLIVTKGLK